MTVAPKVATTGKAFDSLQQLGILMKPGRDSITIGKVAHDDAAYKAGLCAGDTIISVNREPLFDTEIQRRSAKL